MALAQLSLKLPPEVLADWRRRAAEAGHGASVRDWLLAELNRPAADAPAPGVADRLAQLEATTAALAEAVAQLGAIRTGSPRPAPGGLGEPLELAPSIAAADAPAGSLTTAEVAERTGTNRAAWNHWAAAAGRVGTVRHHRTAGSWRLMGKVAPPSGGPDRWLWERVEA